MPTLRKEFDVLPLVPNVKLPDHNPVNVIVDATFFGHEYGYLCFHDGRQLIHFREIKTESLAELDAGLNTLITAGYRFKSFTLDGKRGFIKQLKYRFETTPVQMCHFHQKAIIRRYITNNPKTPCGQALKNLMTRFGKQEPQEWIDALFSLREEYKTFLIEKNENGEYIHRRIRSAFRSLKTNLPYLFVYSEISDAQIPNTTNRLEGIFSHLKEKVRLHRGLSKNRKKKATQYLLYWS